MGAASTIGGLTPIPGGGAIGSVVDSVGNVISGLTHKAEVGAKSADAQKTANLMPGGIPPKGSVAGGYWGLRAYLKSLIPIPAYVLQQVNGTGITEFGILNTPAQGAPVPLNQVLQAAFNVSKAANATTPGLGNKTTPIAITPATSESQALAQSLATNPNLTSGVVKAPGVVKASSNTIIYIIIGAVVLIGVYFLFLRKK